MKKGELSFALIWRSGRDKVNLIHQKITLTFQQVDLKGLFPFRVSQLCIPSSTVCIMPEKD